MIQIIQTGTFCSLNKGDAAMQVVALRGLARAFPGARITVFTPHPGIDRSFYQGVQLFPCSRRKPLRALFLVGRAMGWSIVRRLFGSNWQWLIGDRELVRYRQAHLVVDLSGDGLSEDLGIRCVLSHLVPIALSLLLGVPVVLCAQSIGPFRFTRVLSRGILKRVTLIIPRDQPTYEYLLAAGIRRQMTPVTADLSCLLEPAGEEQVKGILRREGVDRLKGPWIGICLSRMGHRRLKKDSWETAIASVLDRLIETLGVEVVFLAHVMGPGKKRDDRIANREVYERLRNRNRASLIAGDYTPWELKGLMGRFSLFVGFRLHASISAVGMGVPTVVVSYSKKFLGFMEALGQEGRVVDGASLDPQKLFSMIERTWQDREAIRRELIERMEEMRTRASKNIELIEKIVEKYARGL